MNEHVAREVIAERVVLRDLLRGYAKQVYEKMEKQELVGDTEKARELRARAMALDFTADLVRELPAPEVDDKEYLTWFKAAFGVSSKEELVQRFDELNKFKRDVLEAYHKDDVYQADNLFQVLGEYA